MSLYTRVKIDKHFVIRVNNPHTEDQRWFLLDTRKPSKPVAVSTPDDKTAAQTALREKIATIGPENIGDPREWPGTWAEFRDAPDGAFWPKG